MSKFKKTSNFVLHKISRYEDLMTAGRFEINGNTIELSTANDFPECYYSKKLLPENITFDKTSSLCTFTLSYNGKQITLGIHN